MLRSKSVLGLVFLASLSLQAALPAAPLVQSTVPRWSTTEIVLTASGSYGNPYTDVGVTATFSGPGGTSKTVRGFWAGGSTFRIRFTPTAVGTWTYTTSSTDAGLNGKSGTISCAAPSAGSRGFLRRDVANPYTWVWDDGTRHFMWGQTYYDILRTAMGANTWKTAIDNSAAYGMTKVRLHVYAQGDYAGIGEGTSPYPDVQPFMGSSTSPNHDQLNLPYWSKLDEVVTYLASKGMGADLLLFNPYQGGRNFGTQVQDERYLRYIVARYAAYSNVLWCVGQEWDRSPKPQSYWDTMGGIVRIEDPWMSEGSFLRPLSIHPYGASSDFKFFGSSWPAHVILQWSIQGDGSANGAITRHWGHNMPVVNDEYGYIGWVSRTTLRNEIWGTAVAGGYGSAGDARRFGPVEPEISGEWHDAPEYGDLQTMIKLFTNSGLQYWKMSSQNSLVTSGARVYVLAEPGQQYVVYAAQGGSFSISLASGTYSARRLDPRSGTDVALPDVSGGGSRSFTLPDSNDWVVYLKSSGSTPVSPPAAPSGLSATTLSSSQIDLSWADNSSNETGFEIERAASSTGPWTQIATVGANVTTYSNTGLAASTTYYYRVRATNTAGDSANSSVASATTLAGGGGGSGTGLTGEYFDSVDLTNPVLTRLDGTVDFNWGLGSPDTSIGADTFSVRWSGQVQAQFSETYTFTTWSDDGVRLWVNGQLLIDNWTFHGVTEDSGTIPLTGGQRFAITMEFFENGYDAVARLLWSSPSTPQQVIPQSQLFPSNGAPSPPSADADGDGLPDAWETTHFNGLTQGPGDDPDRDGADNLAEYQAGSDPMNPASLPGGGGGPASASGGGGGGSGGCGATGMEVVLLLGMLCLARVRLRR